MIWRFSKMDVPDLFFKQFRWATIGNNILAYLNSQLAAHIVGR
jgi:hypothetical protein